MSEEIDELKDTISELEYDNADLNAELDELREEIQCLRETSAKALSLYRMGDFKECLFAIEKNFPDEFIGFAEACIKHFGGEI